MKAKINITFEIEYEINPKNYPSDLSNQEMLEIDIQSNKEDPWPIIESIGEWTVTGELLTT